MAIINPQKAQIYCMIIPYLTFYWCEIVLLDYPRCNPPLLEWDCINWLCKAQRTFAEATWARLLHEEFWWSNWFSHRIRRSCDFKILRHNLPLGIIICVKNHVCRKQCCMSVLVCWTINWISCITTITTFQKYFGLQVLFSVLTNKLLPETALNKVQYIHDMDLLGDSPFTAGF